MKRRDIIAATERMVFEALPEHRRLDAPEDAGRLGHLVRELIRDRDGWKARARRAESARDRAPVERERRGQGAAAYGDGPT
jgi:hypothetical protein